MMSKYILWVGGIDDHYDTYEEAYEDLLKWKSKGFSSYDDLIIEEVDDE